MEHERTTALVRTILTHAESFPWRLQEAGLLGLWLDDRRQHRLHVWAPDDVVGEPPVHDHPFDFTSTVVVGELINTRYVESASGSEWVRERYLVGHEGDRRVDTVRLEGRSERIGTGGTYEQRAHELHDSRQVAGTVTLIRFATRDVTGVELTSCRRAGTPWVSGLARDASPDEVKRLTAAALAHLA